MLKVLRNTCSLGENLMMLFTSSDLANRFKSAFVFLATILVSLSSWSADKAVVSDEAQRWATNMTKGVTGVSNEIFDLHMLIFWICVVIGIVVFGIMFYSMINHRKSSGAVASCSAWPEGSASPSCCELDRKLPACSSIRIARGVGL